MGLSSAIPIEPINKAALVNNGYLSLGLSSYTLSDEIKPAPYSNFVQGHKGLVFQMTFVRKISGSFLVTSTAIISQLYCIR